MSSRLMVFAGIALLALGGCKKDLSEVTDAQLLQLLGTDAGEGRPALISARTMECVVVMGPSPSDTTGPIPPELLTAMQGDCRPYLETLLSDSGRNPMGLTLEDFAQPDLPARVPELARAQQAEHAALEAAEARQRILTGIAEAREQSAAARIELDDLTAQLQPICDEYAELRAALMEKNRFHALFSKGINMQCIQTPVLDRERQDLDAFNGRLDALTTELESDTARARNRSVPRVPNIGAENIRIQIADIQGDIENLRAALLEE